MRTIPGTIYAHGEHGGLKVVVKRFYNFGFGIASPLHLDPYNNMPCVKNAPSQSVSTVSGPSATLEGGSSFRLPVQSSSKPIT